MLATYYASIMFSDTSYAQNYAVIIAIDLGLVQIVMSSRMTWVLVEVKPPYLLRQSLL